VEMCGDGWKTENGVLLFIYTSVITVSLASNSSTKILQVARYHYPLSPIVAFFWCRICAYFVEFR